jgi:hypothetical protein
MAFQFENLDAQTRAYMLEELERDLREGTLYLSPRLTARGRADYPDLLRAALESSTEVSLAESLRTHRRLNALEPRTKRNGEVYLAKVPKSAAETLAAGEFNRYYARGLCCRAMREGIKYLVVYRAKTVRRPRPASEAILGLKVEPEALLEDLRTNPGIDPAFGLPAGSNSGISVRFPD